MLYQCFFYHCFNSISKVGPKKLPAKTGRIYDILTNYLPEISFCFQPHTRHMYAFLRTYFSFPSDAPGSPTVVVDIEATSIIISWTKPADDGGSPITAYRVLILQGNTVIRNVNITNLSFKQLIIGGLTKSTNYSVKLFARNYVFEGSASEQNLQTKFEGERIMLLSMRSCSSVFS